MQSGGTPLEVSIALRAPLKDAGPCTGTLKYPDVTPDCDGDYEAVFEVDDFYEGMFCIIRGLKIVAERTSWDDWAWSYPGGLNARRSLECVQNRTAVEDVSHVAGIRAIFATSF